MVHVMQTGGPRSASSSRHPTNTTLPRHLPASQSGSRRSTPAAIQNPEFIIQNFRKFRDTHRTISIRRAWADVLEPACHPRQTTSPNDGYVRFDPTATPIPTAAAACGSARSVIRSGPCWGALPPVAVLLGGGRRLGRTGVGWERRRWDAQCGAGPGAQPRVRLQEACAPPLWEGSRSGRRVLRSSGCWCRFALCGAGVGPGPLLVARRPLWTALPPGVSGLGAQTPVPLNCYPPSP